jgi:hypothetical protein
MDEVTKHGDGHFQLDTRLKADCEFVANLGVCRLLLMNNASIAPLMPQYISPCKAN